jgi:hypothetical protein
LFSAANGTQFSQKQLQQLQQFYHRRIMSTPNIAQGELVENCIRFDVV